jgi:hypothetical protein
MSSKKKSSSYRNKINCEQFSFLLQNEVKVYPISVPRTKKWQIQVSIYDNIVKTFSKELMPDDIQEAIDKTMLWYYDKLKNPKQ